MTGWHNPLCVTLGRQMRDATKVWLIIGATLTLAGVLLHAAARMAGL